eukprot:scaffold251418_cov16-Prasinocladus_malaysianus.AAC.1
MAASPCQIADVDLTGCPATSASERDKDMPLRAHAAHLFSIPNISFIIIIRATYLPTSNLPN